MMIMMIYGDDEDEDALFDVSGRREMWNWD